MTADPRGAAARYRARNRKLIAARAADHRSRNADRPDDEVQAARARLRPDGLKTCPRCTAAKPFAEFGADRTEPDGLTGRCRTCRSVRAVP